MLIYMLCANYEFAQSMDCPAQSNDRYFFVQQTMDYLRIPWIAYTLLFAQSMDRFTVHHDKFQRIN